MITDRQTEASTRSASALLLAADNNYKCRLQITSQAIPAKFEHHDLVGFMSIVGQKIGENVILRNITHDITELHRKSDVRNCKNIDICTCLLYTSPSPRD